MLYLLHEAPPEEQNFSMVMEMIAAAEVHEDDDNYQSPLDILDVYKRQAYLRRKVEPPKDRMPRMPVKIKRKDKVL